MNSEKVLKQNSARSGVQLALHFSCYLNASVFFKKSVITVFTLKIDRVNFCFVEPPDPVNI